MTDINNDNLEDFNEEKLKDDEIGELALTFACTSLLDIYAEIPEEDMYETRVSINAGKLADCLEMLMEYAEIYEDLDVESHMVDAEITRQIGSYNFNSNLIH